MFGDYIKNGLGRIIRFKNKKTGEIKTQLNIFELGDYEELEE